MVFALPVLEQAFIEKKEEVGPGIFLFDLTAPQIAVLARPGRFVMVTVPGRDLVLRRPLGIHKIRYEKGKPVGIKMLVRVVGEGTRRLADLPVSASISVLGPCGTGFSPPRRDEDVVIVGAGIGAAPLEALLQKVDPGRTVVFYGAKTEAELVWEPVAEKVFLATEDGSRGYKGTVVDLINDRVSSLKGEKQIWYLCGPVPFLAAAAPGLVGKNRRVEVSLERRMACGYGVCLGCAVPVIEEGVFKRLRACVEGPVFNAELVAWKTLVKEE